MITELSFYLVKVSEGNIVKSKSDNRTATTPSVDIYVIRSTFPTLMIGKYGDVRLTSIARRYDTEINTWAHKRLLELSIVGRYYRI